MNCSLVRRSANNLLQLDEKLFGGCENCLFVFLKLKGLFLQLGTFVLVLFGTRLLDLVVGQNVF